MCFIFPADGEYRRIPARSGIVASVIAPHGAVHAGLTHSALTLWEDFPRLHWIFRSPTAERERSRERWAFNAQRHHLVIELPWDLPVARAAWTMWKPHCWLWAWVWIFVPACWHRPHTPACRMASNERLYEVWMLYCNKVKCTSVPKKRPFPVSHLCSALAWI